MLRQHRLTAVVATERTFTRLSKLTTMSGIFTEVREAPLFVGRYIANCLLVQTNLGRRFEDGYTFVHTMNSFVRRLTNIPYVLTGIGLLQHFQNFPIPELRVTTVRLRFNIVPPHVLLTFGERPGRFMSHRTRLTRDTTVCIENEGKLLLRVFLLVHIGRHTTQLPVIYFRHFLTSIKTGTKGYRFWLLICVTKDRIRFGGPEGPSSPNT